MPLHSLIHYLKSGSKRTGSRTRLWLEDLEERRLLSAYVVTTTADSGSGSLRDAITQIDADTSHTAYPSPSNSSVDEIDFNITAASDTGGGYNAITGVAIIQPHSLLPTITNAVIINGYTQLGASPNILANGDNANLKIDLDGSQGTILGIGENGQPGIIGIGLRVNAPNSRIQGLTVTNWASYGIWLDLNSSHSTVAGNFLGTDVTGTSAEPNGGGPLLQVHNNTSNAAILVNSGNNVIGGIDPASRNLVSGNATDGIIIEDSYDTYGQPPGIVVGNQVLGNFVGTDVTGTKPLGNASNGVVAAGGVDNTTIGGTTPGARNVISANTGTHPGYDEGGGKGLSVGFSVGIVVQGNFIGTDVTGTKSLGNASLGLLVGGGTNTTVGGTAPGARNVISGNPIGVQVGGSIGTAIQGNYIGTDITGTMALGNGDGIWVFGNSSGTGTTVGGTAPGAGNLISGNQGRGIRLFFDGSVIQGNLIGTDVTGTKALGNALQSGDGSGIAAQDGGNNNLIGGTTAGARNVISGNGANGGILFLTGGSNTMSGNVVEGNYIGTDITGTRAIGNIGAGVRLFGIGVTNTTIGGTATGAGNIIAFNSIDGVDVNSSTGNAILSNSIYANFQGGIVLTNNGNDNQAAPVLTGVSSSASGTTLAGSLHSVARTTFRLEFFSNTTADPSGYGQGQTFLGFTTVTTDASGNVSFSVTLASPLPAGQTVFSATATNQTTNDTSQFCLDISIPAVGAITAPTAPVAVNTTISASAPFTDAFRSTTHTAVWNWGDNSTSPGSVTETNGSGTVSGSHTYAVDGVYTITLTVTNNVGGSAQSLFQYVVVYDPSAGFVTGGGWIASPAGAYAANPALTGKATFGLDAKYLPNSTIPAGNTEFQFPTGNLNFHAISYDWLVITINQAQYQGSGTINGAGNYGFLVTALDNGGATPDDIRLKIWDKNHGNVVYDTQPGASQTAAPVTFLGGGRIIIHDRNSPPPPGGSGNGGNKEPLTAQLLDARFALVPKLPFVAHSSMDSQSLFGDKNLQLIEVAQEVLLELSKEPRAALTTEIEDGHDDHLIKIELCFALPDAPEREVALLRGQTAKLSDEPFLDDIEHCIGDGPAGIIGQRQV